ncbi:PREDICTED: actin-related protein 10-like, partial [Priapulus caudatus]|uniref:Actin-related protein 10-like n=1 Tax=Priapulus caudatus TaxID=37621 RepID=A0ABM1E4M1_PRICU
WSEEETYTANKDLSTIFNTRYIPGTRETWNVRCGFAGETGPRFIIPSEVSYPHAKKVVKISECSRLTESYLYETLVDFIHMLYFRHLLVNPKDRKVVIIESLLCPSSFRNTLAKVLFKHYEVASVLFAPNHLMALFTLGVQTALVVDVGYTETFALPIYDGVPILGAWQTLPVAGQAIHGSIEKKLLENCKVTTELAENVLLSSLLDSIKEDVLEDIKVRMCFVTKMERAVEYQNAIQEDGSVDYAKLPPLPPIVDYPVDGNKILHICGSIRETAAEVLFDYDLEQQSLPSVILDCILKCPIDMRKVLSENIVVTGGTATLPGFTHRLQGELLRLVQTPKYARSLAVRRFAFHAAPAKPNYTSWLGGAIFGASEVLASRSVSKESYLESGVIPDWSSIAERVSTKDDDRPTIQ